MNLEITGKVMNVLPTQSGNGKNGEWVKNFFVIQTQGEYPKNICFSVMGKEKWEKMNIQVGMTYNVSFDVESREWNGKYFTDLNAWKAVNLNGGQNGQTQQPAPTAAPNPQPAPTNGVSPFPTADAQPSGDADSLPF